MLTSIEPQREGNQLFIGEDKAAVPILPVIPAVRRNRINARAEVLSLPGEAVPLRA